MWSPQIRAVQFQKFYFLILGAFKREIKTETTGSFTYNFSVLKKVPEEPNFLVNCTALPQMYLEWRYRILGYIKVSQSFLKGNKSFAKFHKVS
jgi:hypothetical protein